jgi:hypothetical protein
LNCCVQFLQGTLIARHLLKEDAIREYRPTGNCGVRIDATVLSAACDKCCHASAESRSGRSSLDGGSRPSRAPAPCLSDRGGAALRCEVVRRSTAALRAACKRVQVGLGLRRIPGRDEDDAVHDAVGSESVTVLTRRVRSVHVIVARPGNFERRLPAAAGAPQ